MKKLINLLAVLSSGLLVGCASTHTQPFDYSAYQSADPKSILVLPPKNSSPDVKASDSVYSHTQAPLAEAGYYVLPITLVDETFKNNGLTVNDEIHLVDTGKLHQIFGADAALYIDIKEYGTKYLVVNSASVVSAAGKLIDLRSGKLLWEGKATASSTEGENHSGGLTGMLVSALVKQIVGTVLEQSHDIAKITTHRLLSPTAAGGILPGPRSPLYKSK